MSARIHRPYSHIRGTEPSVTTILDLLPKPGLPWGASKEAATFAVKHPDRWQHLPEAEAIDLLRKHPFGIWNGRAAVGTLVHAVNEAYCDGEVVDLDRLINETIETDTNARTWKEMDRDELTEQVLGYVLGLEKWWDAFQPTHIISEQVVRWPGAFIGTLDIRCTITGDDWLLDIKSTATQDEEKGMYPDSWGLQLAALGMARETVHYETEDAPNLKRGFRVKEASTGPWSRPERYGIIHLRGDEGFSFFEVPVTREVERTFIRLARAYPVVTKLAKTDLARVEPIQEAVA